MKLLILGQLSVNFKNRNGLAWRLGCTAGVFVFSFVLYATVSGGETGRALLLGLVLSLYFYRWGTNSKNSTTNRKTKKKYQFLKDQTDFTNSLLVLIAQVINVDNKEGHIEMKYVRKSLNLHFSEQDVERFMKQIKLYGSKEQLNVVPICRLIRSNFDVPSKVQLMHLLIGICASDGLMTKSEEKLLKSIAVEIRMPFKTYKQLLGMFYFKHEGFHQKKKRTVSTTAYQLAKAYEILGLTESANVNQIKKAYRKLALKHHPDRVIHLGHAYQKSAKEKFQLISDAYELIKLKKGFA